MFTGLVETIGSKTSSLLTLIAPTTNAFELAVTALEPLDTTTSGGGGTSLTISDCEEILTDAHLGDSIAVNGNHSSQILSPLYTGSV
jgi:riboflavin synthase